MNFKRIFMTLMVTATIAAFAADKQELNFTVLPKMSCQNCKGNLIFTGWYDGDTCIGQAGEEFTVQSDITLKAHFEKKEAVKVTITFDPEKTNETKIIEAFSKIGYKASVIKDRPKDQSVSDKASPNKSN